MAAIAAAIGERLILRIGFSPSIFSNLVPAVSRDWLLRQFPGAVGDRIVYSGLGKGPEPESTAIAHAAGFNLA
jgi:hypothetical protein